MDWVGVSGGEARQHYLYGFGGWLWLFYAAELLGLGMTLHAVVLVAGAAGVAGLADPALAAVWPHLALSLPFLVMAPARARLMPRVAIACYWAGILLGARLFFVPGVAFGEVALWLPTLAWAAWGVLFTLYLLRSARVNVTYRHRVTPEDAAALAAAPVPAAPVRG